MSDFKAQLDAAMGDPPRSTVDIDRIVRRQQRAGRLRMAGAGGATAAVLAGTVAGAMAVTGAGSAPAGPAASPVTTMPPPSPTPSPAAPTPARCPGGARVTGSLPPGAGPRLSAALEAAVRAEIGSTRLYPFDDNGVRRAPLRFFNGPCSAEEGQRNEYVAVAQLQPRPLTTPILSVYVQTHDVTGCSEGSDRACTVSRGPGGEVIQSVTERGDLQGQRQVRTFVVITKRDGTVLQLVASKPGGPSVQPPLSVAQLTRIGLAPGLTVSR